MHGYQVQGSYGQGQAINEQPTSPFSSTPKPHTCLHPSCPDKFARYYDLQRHMEIHFPAMRLDCPYAARGSCGRAGEKTETSKGGFMREDHFMDHLREVHGEDIPGNRRSRGESPLAHFRKKSSS